MVNFRCVDTCLVCANKEKTEDKEHPSWVCSVDDTKQRRPAKSAELYVCDSFKPVAMYLKKTSLGLAYCPDSSRKHLFTEG